MSITKRLKSLNLKPDTLVTLTYSEDFGDYLSEVISDNFYDVGLIEYSTEKYDHKRGFCTLTAQVQIAAANIISEAPFLSGWSASVPTENGILMFDA